MIAQHPAIPSLGAGRASHVHSLTPYVTDATDGQRAHSADSVTTMIDLGTINIKMIREAFQSPVAPRWLRGVITDGGRYSASEDLRNRDAYNSLHRNRKTHLDKSLNRVARPLSLLVIPVSFRLYALL